MTVSRPWLLRIAPRAAILATSVAELVSGDLTYGVFCLLALALTLVPAIRARNLDAGVPLELELALLWLMLADMTLGNLFGLYHLPWFDKAVHLGSAALVGTIGFLAIYVLHLTHRTKFHPWLDGLAILLVTLGIGALWEISEFGIDHLLGRMTQGSPTMSAHDDTMTDLIFDALGGLLGALVGPAYMRSSERSRASVASFARMIEDRGIRHGELAS